VADQTYSDIEHVVIDGASTDETIKIVDSFPHVSKIVAEQDKGMYDAINKGIKLATGKYVGILNSDDTLHDPNTIQRLTDEIKKDQLDLYYGDIRFIHTHNRDKTTRYYSAKNWKPSKFKWGYMPPHPSVYIKRSLFEKFGDYQIDYTIAADYELLIRYLFTHKVSYRYLPYCIVDMMPGGVSNRSVKSRLLLNQEIIRGCNENKIQTNLFLLSLKYFKKVFEYFPLSSDRNESN